MKEKIISLFINILFSPGYTEKPCLEKPKKKKKKKQTNKQKNKKTKNKKNKEKAKTKNKKKKNHICSHRFFDTIYLVSSEARGMARSLYMCNLFIIDRV
jgi:hypothetical protein